MRSRVWPFVFVFAAGYEVREAIEFGNWKLVVMACCLLGLAAVADSRVREGQGS